MYSSIMKKGIAFPGMLQVHRQVMMSSLLKQMVDVKGNEDTILVPEYSSHIPDIPGVYLETAFMFWRGWNLEDAAVISKSAADKLTTLVKNEQKLITTSKPELVVDKGDIIKRGTLLGKWKLTADEANCGYPKRDEDNIFTADVPLPGTVTNIEQYTEYRNGNVVWNTKVTVEIVYRCCVGSKISNMHSSKSIIGRVLPDHMMPHVGNKPTELIISPFSIARRMAPSCVMEVMLNTYIFELRKVFGEPIKMVIKPFDPDINFEAVAANLVALGIPDDCKYWVSDGLNGKVFDKKVLVGPMRVGRLLHHSIDKIRYNGNIPSNFKGVPRRGSGAQRLGREEIEVLVEHGADGMIEEVKYWQNQSRVTDRINDLLECIGYSHEG